MKNRVPRKLKKKIPIGMYCYTGLRYDNSTGIFHVKPCPFYSNGLSIIDIESQTLSINRGRKIESINSGLIYNEMKVEDHPNYFISLSGNGGWCRLRPAGGIDDQCKSCGIKMYYERSDKRYDKKMRMSKLKKKIWKKLKK